MKILHLYSNWKWTGPAEHAVNLALQQQKDGHDVVFACGAPPDGVPESLVVSATRAGIVPVTDFRLCKHFNLVANLGDFPRLRSFIKKGNFDVVHTHLPNDHHLAGMALKTLLVKTVLVRSCYDGDGVKGGMRSRLLFSFMTDALITYSERTKEQIMRKRYLSARKIWKSDVPVNLERFDPGKVQNNRDGFGLAREAIVGGIVARVQKHRRFEVLLEALQIVLNEFPNLRFMIIGRGTHIQEVAVKPSLKMGIRSNLIFTGYKQEDFVSTLASLDFKVFLVPGSDGSCRAVREAMAMGIPIIAADRGMLPEMIEHQKEGFVIEDTPEKLAQTILYFIEHPDERRQMGKNAHDKARKQFNPEVQAKRIESLYLKTLQWKFERQWRLMFMSQAKRKKVAEEAMQKISK